MNYTKRKLLVLIMTAVMLFGCVPIQAAVVVNHDLYKDLNTDSQRKAYKALVNYLQKGAKGKKYKYEQSLYKGRLSDADMDELRGIIATEYFGIYGDCKIDYFDRGDGIVEIVANPSRDIGTYKKNVKYTKTIQKKAKSIVKGAKSQKAKCDKIQNWICKHVTYQTGKVGGLSTSDAWCAYKKGKALCEGYSQLYKCMLNGVGINCREFNGYGEDEGRWENHEFSAVKINGKWYYSDITFYDSSRESTYRYSAKLWSDHKIDVDFYRTK